MTEGTKALVITTFNREDSFKELYESIPFHELDITIVVNAGKPYKEDYSRVDQLIWHQVEGEKNIAGTRNIGLKIAKDLGMEHIFLSEDDMIITGESIFDEYLQASRISGLKYFCFTSYAWDAGPPGARTPRLITEYRDDFKLHFNKNMCNEFTYRHVSLLETVGYYDETFKSFFDVDWVYRASKDPAVSEFWYFADISNSDKFIRNNDKVQSNIDPDGDRWKKLMPDYDYFNQKFGFQVSQIPLTPQTEQIAKLKRLVGK